MDEYTQAQTVERLWAFIRNDLPTPEFEQWVYQSPHLEGLLGLNLYLDVISLKYENGRAVIDLAHKLEDWLNENIPRTCNCVTWPRTGKSHPPFWENHWVERLELVRPQNPWQKLMRCPACGAYWYIALNAPDDGHYLYWLTATEVEKILSQNEWPAVFENLPDTYDQPVEFDHLPPVDLKLTSDSRGWLERFLSDVLAALSSLIDLIRGSAR